MFKALFVPQGYLTLAALAVLGYRHWTGNWPRYTDLSAERGSQQSLSWDRETDELLDNQQLQTLKRDILEQLARMDSVQRKTEL